MTRLTMIIVSDTRHSLLLRQRQPDLNPFIGCIDPSVPGHTLSDHDFHATIIFIELFLLPCLALFYVLCFLMKSMY